MKPFRILARNVSNPSRPSRKARLPSASSHNPNPLPPARSQAPFPGSPSTSPNTPRGSPLSGARYSLYGAVTLAAGLGCYTTWLVISYYQASSRLAPEQRTSDPSTQKDVSSRFSNTDFAGGYDADVSLSEWFQGLKAKRKSMVEQARGHVLEVSVGTGRNTAFFIERLARQEEQAMNQAKWKSNQHNGTGMAGSLFGVIDDEGASKGGADEAVIKSVTFVDRSPEMVEIARNKWEEELKRRKDLARQRGMFAAVPGAMRGGTLQDRAGVRWVVGDAENMSDIPSAPTNGKGDLLTIPSSSSPAVSEGGKYDTIIQTMGLCSTGDPIKLLQNLASLLKRPSLALPTPSPSSAPDNNFKNSPGSIPTSVGGGGGKIILLEHGRSHYTWLNNLLDSTAPGRAEKYGCWYNRDIGQIVESAIGTAPSTNTTTSSTVRPHSPPTPLSSFSSSSSSPSSASSWTKRASGTGSPSSSSSSSSQNPTNLDLDLQITSIKRHHFGTTWEIVLEPVTNTNTNI